MTPTIEAPKANGDQPVWWGGELARHREELAVATAALLAREHEWVHRRIHRIDYVDSDHIQWALIVDIAVPVLPEFPHSLPLIVPLAMPEKGPLLNLDVRDEDGRPLPVLTYAENTELAAKVLELQAAEVLGENTPFDPFLGQRLRAVVGAAQTPTDRSDIAHRHHRAELAVEAFERAHRNEVATSTANTQMKALWRDPAMQSLIRLLARRFFLFVQIDGPASQHERLCRQSRRIITITYERKLGIEEDDPLAADREPTRWRRRLRRLLPRPLSQELALSSYSSSFGMRAFRGAQSFHVEVHVPDELLIRRAKLQHFIRVAPTGAPVHWTKGYDIPEVEKVRSAHMHAARDSLRPLVTSASENGEIMLLSVSLVWRFGVLLPTLMLSGLTSVTLCGGLFLRAVGVTPAAEAAALLVAAPSLFMSYIAPGEHLLARRMFQRLRLLIMVSATTGFLGAAAIAVDLRTRWTVAAWAVAAGMSLISTGVLSLAAVHSWESARIRRH